MSRIGLNPINIPEKVNVDLQNGTLKINGPKGEQSVNIPTGIDVVIDNNQIAFSRQNDTKNLKSVHGLTRALANNAVIGVSEGIKKVMKIEGVGFKVEMTGNNLLLSLGFSHLVCVVPPKGVELAAPNPSTIEVLGIDKQLVGQTAAVIRKIRKPEPYKGKGIRYEGEYVRRKAGKTGA